MLTRRYSTAFTEHMNIADPHGPMSPYGKVGSIVNVVMSAVFGGIAVVVGIVIGEPMPFVGGARLLGDVCLRLRADHASRDQVRAREERAPRWRDSLPA